MKYRDDYAAAGVPMLAVVRGRAQVGLQVILYAWATVACSLLLIPVAGMGLLYSAVAFVTGVWFVYETHRLYNLAIRHEQGLADAGLPRVDRVPLAALPRDRRSTRCCRSDADARTAGSPAVPRGAASTPCAGMRIRDLACSR